MAKLKIFTVYDSKAEAYLQPFFMPTTGLALRGFIDVANDPKTQFNKYPADYTLFEVGEFDETNAIITNYEHKKNLGSALEHNTQKQIEKITTLPQQNITQ